MFVKNDNGRLHVKIPILHVHAVLKLWEKRHLIALFCSIWLLDERLALWQLKCYLGK